MARRSQSLAERQLGFSPIFMVDEHPLPWLAPLLNGVEHANFYNRNWSPLYRCHPI